MINIDLGLEWNSVLESEFGKSYFKQLIATLDNEYNNYEIFPPQDQLFNAFKLTPYSKIKAVILGQDPYHDNNQACGISFGINTGAKFPPSLRNIYTELEDDLGITTDRSGDLTNWCKQGVLMLNTILSVRAHKPASHHNIGWEIFTDEVISRINYLDKPIVFVLWGKYALSKERLITNPRFKIIKGVHPSPLSSYRGFFGSKPFSKINNFLIENKENPILW